MNVLQHLGPRIDMASLVSATILRLCLAAFLGGVIGLQRQLKRTPAGPINNVLGGRRKMMRTVQMGGSKDALRVQFAVEATLKEQRLIAQDLRKEGHIERLAVIEGEEQE